MALEYYYDMFTQLNETSVPNSRESATWILFLCSALFKTKLCAVLILNPLLPLQPTSLYIYLSPTLISLASKYLFTLCHKSIHRSMLYMAKLSTKNLPQSLLNWSHLHFPTNALPSPLSYKCTLFLSDSFLLFHLSI